jgi:hypothetical protein
MQPAYILWLLLGTVPPGSRRFPAEGVVRVTASPTAAAASAVPSRKRVMTVLVSAEAPRQGSYSSTWVEQQPTDAWLERAVVPLADRTTSERPTATEARAGAVHRATR